jgi:Acyl-CoA synthetases (AMP-forming)/AMP-acid ligases II
VRLTDFLDKGTSLGAEAPCLTAAGRTLTYFDVQRLSWRVARALDRSGIAPGDKVAILSANDPVAFGCVFGISRAARCGARSTRATRRPRTVTCSTSSTARA